jgi:hypothetical protein
MPLEQTFGKRDYTNICSVRDTENTRSLVGNMGTDVHHEQTFENSRVNEWTFGEQTYCKGISVDTG